MSLLRCDIFSWLFSKTATLAVAVFSSIVVNVGNLVSVAKSVGDELDGFYELTC